ncbi:bifunctional aspartate transaminase/aspartate 4-decarboxylase [Desulfovibrio sulfodismutans]|uniref:Bifunctional aspartate transaminase/aspartate 4-decarboxylase n=1 Tax=Desulfolutivibrio sulfodismutans TaxID=63561 RepID=A0A7K3NK05_9BACT|nr:bifunctional aspartate transaminase/aspartate 4-decarboxylase [Desulfolutivibrio sulfodismutans]NDY56457.1 bifunctional aspartate transaminase/aspartate 4-decarboxylase [Desulfolutivibrio sulfodismutans]QLA12804.1 bifunctional aspartate transaminase/aspartate 4-decarboxylase [Desulfolutivibrio sulfodismutans DSM 3696]
MQDGQRDEEKRYESLSPFELKNKLADLAQTHHEKLMINAGRGNPNWIATIPREAFFLFGQFALREAHRVMSRPGMAGSPDGAGSGARLLSFCESHGDRGGAQFLADAYAYVTKTLALDGDAFVGEMTDAILGDHYPTPDRVLPLTEKVVQAYLAETMFDGRPPAGTMDLFLVEGGTAAISYLFNTLKENGLLNPGDKLAIATPIFSPYLEIPPLADYELVSVDVAMDEDAGWQFPDAELAKLRDPAVKAFFLVNPSNPPSVSLTEASLQVIADLVRTERKDLIILTDDVYGTFVNGFRSLAAIAPRNTILVYSFSKYFGCTGWRLGVIGLYQDNVIDEMIAALPTDRRRGLHNRYASITTDPDGLKIIDRLVADSRAVALNHTAGLSTPQQAMMVFFSLAELLDTEFHLYKKEAQGLVKERYDALYAGMGLKSPDLDASYARYYTTIDIHKLAVERYGAEFDAWLRDDHEPIDFVWRLAEDKDVVLMDGGGFAGPNMSVRVSQANLDTGEYVKIGKAISELLADYKKEWDARRA